MGQLKNRLKWYRQERGWSQEELARRSGIARASVSAIEGQRLVPSVAAALALAAAFQCRVEDLFGAAEPETQAAWAWTPTRPPCRFWQAQAGGRVLCYPVELSGAGVIPQDGIYRNGAWILTRAVDPKRTLVMACCDPAAGLLAAEYAKNSGFRLLVLSRSSRQALDLLRRKLVDVAGVHLAAARQEHGNAQAVWSELGAGYRLLKVADWQEGLAVSTARKVVTVKSLLRARLRWVGREAGSGARQCQDELLGSRPPPRRLVQDHRGVAAAIRNGWADAGICLELASAEAGLNFVALRQENYELCFPAELDTDPRIHALLQTVRSAAYRQYLGELPGYDTSRGGEVHSVQGR
jgi:molybdate-binding protein/DNA-binding XRE family transcriptional regulator